MSAAAAGHPAQLQERANAAAWAGEHGLLEEGLPPGGAWWTTTLAALPFLARATSVRDVGGYRLLADPSERPLPADGMNGVTAPAAGAER